jgi:hypothetical protein
MHGAVLGWIAAVWLVLGAYLLVAHRTSRVADQSLIRSLPAALLGAFVIIYGLSISLGGWLPTVQIIAAVAATLAAGWLWRDSGFYGTNLGFTQGIALTWAKAGRWAANIEPIGSAATVKGL